MTVEDLMHRGDQIPVVGPGTPMKDVIYEMSRKVLGITTVQDEAGHLLGVLTDGDLRRLMETDPDPLRHTAGEVLHTGGVTIPPKALATAALRLLELRRITSVVVTTPDRTYSAYFTSTTSGASGSFEPWPVARPPFPAPGLLETRDASRAEVRRGRRLETHSGGAGDWVATLSRQSR